MFMTTQNDDTLPPTYHFYLLEQCSTITNAAVGFDDAHSHSCSHVRHRSYIRHTGDSVCISVLYIYILIFFFSL